MSEEELKKEVVNFKMIKDKFGVIKDENNK